MKQRAFCPTEIIFSCTTACNLHCEHCFVNRESKKLDIKEALAFLNTCAQSGTIEKVGFSGGEPFLYMEFLFEMSRAVVEHDMLFDQIMTNGDWWQTEEDLNQTLLTLYDAGYDGKIGLSWDKYHGQTAERMNTFIKSVQTIFGHDSINIQTVGEVSPSLQSASALPLPPLTGDAPVMPPDIPIYTLPRTYPSEDPNGWNSKHWFKEDYCEGPGNILYVHSDGNIAPCCGFANENPALFIGNITDSFETIMQNASQNKMIQLCFSQGLSRYRRFKKFPGKTSDICTFCDYVCKHI